jgi:hypothetical protein
MIARATQRGLSAQRFEGLLSRCRIKGSQEKAKRFALSLRT